MLNNNKRFKNLVFGNVNKGNLNVFYYKNKQTTHKHRSYL
jgi:hypothetical protein